MIESFQFLQPYWLIALIPPLLWLWFGRHKKLLLPALVQQVKVRYPALSLIDSDEQYKISASNLSARNSVPVLFFILLIISLAQPAGDGKMLPEKQQADPLDLILVVNTSVSMILKDYIVGGEQVDRMAMSRLLLQKLVSSFKGQRIGLVVMGRPSAIWLPLTSDFSLVSNIIGRLKTTLGGRNSDIAETLALIQKKFTPDSEKSQTIVMMVSDGYEQLGVISPEAAVQELVHDGFKLHTLAIGSAAKPEFSLGKGHLIYQAVDLQLMTQLAKIGGGKMVHVKDLSVTDNVLKNISIAPEQNKKKQGKSIVIPLYQYPLAFSLILLIIMLLPVSFKVLINRVSRE